VKAFAPVLAASAVAVAEATVEPASIDPILARLPGGTLPLCWPHAPRGSCKRARAAENLRGEIELKNVSFEYEPGQPVRFRIIAVQDGHALSGIKVTYRIGPEMMPPKIDQTATLTDDGLTVEGGTMNEPGFLRCIATVEQNGKTYRGLATAAFRPEIIKPTQQEPADFDQFWASGKAALAKLPIDAKITPLPSWVQP